MNCSKRCLIRIFSFGIFALAVLIARNFALMDEAEKSRLALAGSYQSAVEQLADACRNINETLEKQLYANSPDMQKNLAVKLYEQASAAKAALARLPLEKQQLDNTYKFLSQIGNYSLSVSKKLDGDSTVSAQDYENISKLYDFSQKLSQDMWELENSVMSGEIDLRDTKLQMGQSETPSMTDGFSDFEESFDGYNNLGKVRMVRKDDMLFDEVDAIRLAQKESLITNKAVENDEYLQFAAGIAAMIDKSEGLKNGDRFTVSYLYDKDLAKRLRINVDDTESVHTVEGLTDATALTADDLFKDLSVEFSGVSPNVELTINNNSTNPLIQTLVFKPEEYKEYYTAGETVRIRCYFNENERLSDFYYITTPAEECFRDYAVNGTDRYVDSLSQIPDEVIKEAIQAGKKAFVDANEYGVRIFCEAHLVPVYINQQATFR